MKLALIRISVLIYIGFCECVVDRLIFRHRLEPWLYFWMGDTENSEARLHNAGHNMSFSNVTSESNCEKSEFTD